MELKNGEKFTERENRMFQAKRKILKSQNMDILKMKCVIILSTIAVILAKEFDMKLEENGEKFTEKVKIDVTGNTEQIHVPKHGNRLELDMLNDFNVGYRAMKLKAAKVCYISVISKEQTPRQMELSMEKSHATFPIDSYMVLTDKFIRLYKMSDAEVGAKIAAHCAGYEMIFTMKFKKDADVAKIINSQSKRTKRQRTDLLSFTGCSENDTHIPNTCKGKPIITRCTMLTPGASSCIWNIICHIVPGNKWSCGGNHNFHLPFCCKLSC